MGLAALGEKARLAGIVLTIWARGVWRRLAALAGLPREVAHRTPDKLLIAPHDLRTTDPTRAAEIYAGTFALAGRVLETKGGSPFLAAPPSEEWADALHGFAWLRHLRAADTTLARANGRALVNEWIGLRGGPAQSAHKPEVAARRLISWFCHAPLILDGADRAFYRRFLRSATRQTRRLERMFHQTPDGLPRLTAAAALAYAGLCLSGEARLLRTASKRLSQELERQILPDGGHVSRNPAALVGALLDLLPLRQAFTARNASPPQTLLSAIDRMMPMLRFFRHGDGEFAQFNGAGPTSFDLIATALAYDDARGAPVEDAQYSGYQRLAAADGLVIMDAGPPPPFDVSQQAHAGCLSFEFSSGEERVIVNCGSPRFQGGDWFAAGRATAAHSTATVGEVSSCRFTSAGLRRVSGARVLAGPSAASARRERSGDRIGVVASHDGYATRFGVVHERSLWLAQDGLSLTGEDVFRRVEGSRSQSDPAVALRFHLHPSVRATLRDDGFGALLALPSGATWMFSTADAAVSLEESVYLSDARGPRRSEQLVIRASARTTPRIAWSLEVVDEAAYGRSARLPAASTLFGPPPRTA
ncbi:heparinase II/III family protein [Hansschlegelia beijingensis]|uniref:Putative heparinase superfamily protein n=1 Tax=Hansschlegelia beijingensis TaxID=1133344 RepID=A0A7W6GHJ2_9HYPH|nr:heparinase II/III family protein [Hansschlegelia beijingensis]MBB3973849.1 putative heparinase superfamily protein [Hansschlegelia beijingensis]